MAYQTSSTPGSGYGNVYVDSLIWGCQWTNVAGAYGPVTSYSPVNITYSYGYESGLNLSGWSASEIKAFELAFQSYENVCNVNFQQVAYSSSNPAQSNVVLYQAPNSLLGSGVLGMMTPPEGSYSSTLGVFNWQHSSWANLTQGSYGYVTIIHELGHGLGLAHPHDGGSGDAPTTFPGVTSPSSTGTYGLNQGIWTVMTYVDGWNQQPANSNGYGWEATPMAFDIAALQAIYGANTNYNTGSNTYLLPRTNASGTFWSCIWDAGGNDAISNLGSSSACTINLNAAPLVGPNAGGYVSWISGVVGGYTIANGVVIENAIGGSGNDILIGNAAANTLIGGAGNDTLYGLFGNDNLDGGVGADTMVGGLGDDTYLVDNAGDVVTESSSEGTDLVKVGIVTAGGTYTLTSNVENASLTNAVAYNLTGNALNNVLTGNAAANTLNGGAGNDTLYGLAGNDTLIGGLGNDTLYGGNGDDVYHIDELRGGSDIIQDTGGSDTLEWKDFDGSNSLDFERSGNDLVIKTYAIWNDGAWNEWTGLPSQTTTLKNFYTTAGFIENFRSVSDTEDTVLRKFVLGNTGTAANDIMLGTGAAETMTGGAGVDVIGGGAGNDNINGGTDNDLLDGGLGADSLTGGAGNDRFLYANISESTLTGFDTIQDFTRGADKIDLVDIDANTNAAYNNYFSFAGTTATANSVWYGSTSGGVMVYADVNGDSAADIAVKLLGVTELASTDFIL